MLDLHIPFHDFDRTITRIAGPEDGLLKWLTVSQLRLSHQTRNCTFETGDCEGVLDILGGKCTVDVQTGSNKATFPEIGGRANVFAGGPTMVYIPKGAHVSISADSADFDGVLITAPATNEHPPALICPEEAEYRDVGKGNWQRSVVTSIGNNVRADRLIVGETTNPPGNWSSAPPHKHDRYGDCEIPMEEVYLYKLDPPQGFGLQRVYTAPGDGDPFDVTYAIRDGDVVILPRGYHPVVAAPGYRLFYLWALAGEERQYGAWSDDPQHAWIKTTP